METAFASWQRSLTDEDHHGSDELRGRTLVVPIARLECPCFWPILVRGEFLLTLRSVAGRVPDNESANGNLDASPVD